MLKLFSIFDSKANAYMNPFIQATAPAAMRSFGAACCDSNSEFHKFAEDFTLFELGEWDEHTGSILMYVTPRPICKAIEISIAHSQYYFANLQSPSVAA